MVAKQPEVQSLKNLCISCVPAYLGSISFGYTLGYSSPVIPELSKLKILDSTSAESWFGSVITIFAFLGGPIGGWLLEKIGRKKAIICTSFPLIFGWICLCSSTLNTLYLGRMLTGLGSGMAAITSPIYIAEISTKHTRGLFGSGVQLFITIGIFLVNLLGVYCSYSTLALIGLCFPLMNLLGYGMFVETPRWLVMNSRKVEAIESLKWVRNKNDVGDEMGTIEESLDSGEKFSMSEFLRPELYNPLKVSMGLMFFQQFSGINAVLFYTVEIFKLSGFKEQSIYAAVIVGLVQVVATLISCNIMDVVGRRKLLLTTGLGMACTLGVFGLTFKLLDDKMAVGPLALVSLLVYIIFFSFGWGPIPVLVMSEIFPVRARGSASSVAICTNWTCAFLVTYYFVAFNEVLGAAGTFWLFGLFSLASVVFVFKYVPETRGKSLEDIEMYFMGRPSPV